MLNPIIATKLRLAFD